MGRFNEYLRRLDDVSEKNVKLSKDLDTMLEQAKVQCARYHADQLGSHGYVFDPDDLPKAIEAKAKLAAAEQAKEVFWRSLPERTAEKVGAIRAEFAAAVTAAYRADPKQLDAQTLELLKSGILRADEYASLLSDAISRDNLTLARVIGSFADKEADKMERNSDYNGADAFRAVSARAADAAQKPDAFIGAFDCYAEAVKMASENPAMLDADTMAGFSADALTAFNALG